MRSIKEGEEITNFSAFDIEQSVVKPESQEKMNALIEILKNNRELNATIKIAQEQYPPPPVVEAPKDPKPKKAVKPKKGKVAEEAPPPPPPPPQGPNVELYKARVETFKKLLSEVKNAEERVKIVAGESIMPSSGQNNLSAKVGEVKSILED